MTAVVYVGGKSSRPYPNDVTDEEWLFVAPYLTLAREVASQRRHCLSGFFCPPLASAHRGVVARLLPHALPPWELVHKPTQRRLTARCLEATMRDLSVLVRLADIWAGEPSPVILDSRT